MKVEDTFADAVTSWRTTAAFDDRTRLAAEYAERYALDHHGLDDELLGPDEGGATPTARSSSCRCASGSWLAFGRLNHVLGLDAACVLPSHAYRAARATALTGFERHRSGTLSRTCAEPPDPG